MERVHPVISRHPLVAGCVLSLLLLPLAVASLETMNETTVDWPYVLWGLVFAAPFVFVVRRPEWTVGLLAVPLVAQIVVLDEAVTVDLVVLVAVAFLTALRPWRQARWWVLGVLVVLLALVVDWTIELVLFDLSQLLSILVLFLVVGGLVLMAVLSGRFVQAQRDRVAALQETTAALVRGQQLAVELATEHERARIATDMHDIVAHSLAVIVVQTDAAELLLRQPDPGATQLKTAREAVVTAHRVSVEALRDTRQLVGVLGAEGSDRSPQPTLAGLPEFVARLDPLHDRFDVESTVDLSKVPVSPPAQVACCLIVQEALTNVVRHADPNAHATVSLCTRGEELQVTVTDYGPTREHPSGGGHGLANMAQRAASVGGTFSAGPFSGGGFRVLATVPLMKQARRD